MTGLILLCGVRACRSNLCELESAPWTPPRVILLKVMGKWNVSCSYPPSDSSRNTVDLPESRLPLKWADRSSTAVELNKWGCTHKQYKKGHCKVNMKKLGPEISQYRYATSRNSRLRFLDSLSPAHCAGVRLFKAE